MEGIKKRSKYPLIIHGIGGMLSRPEANWLHRIPKVIGDGVYADLGTHHGRSAVLLADTMRNEELSALVITVDIFDDRGLSSRFKDKEREEGGDNRKYSGVLRTIENRSLSKYIQVERSLIVPLGNKLDVTLKFLFIDASHDYDSVKADFLSWSPKLHNDGILAFHDSYAPGVSKFLGEIEEWKEYDRVDSLSVWRRYG